MAGFLPKRIVLVDIKAKLNQLNFQQLLNAIQAWFYPRPLNTTHRCCIQVSPKEITLLHVNKIQDMVEVLLHETIQYDDLASLRLVLTGLTKQYELNKMPLYWLLSLEDYQLFLIDSLPVAKNEFHAALNWRIRSLINYPIEEALTDSFLIPPKKADSETNMVAAVAAKMTPLIKIIEVFQKAELRLSVIDIPELALRNLSALYETEEKKYWHVVFL